LDNPNAWEFIGYCKDGPCLNTNLWDDEEEYVKGAEVVLNGIKYKASQGNTN